MKPNLRALCDQLQAELRLRDWRIDVAYVRDLKAEDGEPVYGLCYHLVDNKQARILIRDPETPAGSDDPSVESTLIHELTHLHFAPLSGDTRAEIAAEEQAVWALAEAFAAAKDAGRRAHIARAMVACAKGATGRRAPRLEERKQGAVAMDMAMLIAALRAAVASGDMAQVEALLAELEKSTGTTGEVPPPAAAAPPEEQPRMQAADEEKPKAQRAPSRPATFARAAAVLAAHPSSPAAEPITREDLDRHMAALERKIERRDVESLLDREGAHLTRAQRSFAAKLTLVGAKEYLATTAPEKPDDEEGEETTRASKAAPRKSSPTVGAKRSSAGGVPPEVEKYIDDKMGLTGPPTQAISRHPVTKRLQISNIATGKVTVARPAPAGGE